MGGKIAFSYLPTGSSTVGIGVASPDGHGTIDLLTPLDGNDHAPAWSPTGTKLTFTRGNPPWQSGAADLYVINADGSGETKLVDGDETHVVQSCRPKPIPLAVREVKLLREQRMARPAGTNLLFPTKLGTVYTKSSFRSVWTPALTSADLEGFKFPGSGTPRSRSWRAPEWRPS